MSLSVVVQGSDERELADCRWALARVVPEAQVIVVGPGAAARNAGLRQATGDHVTFVAAADRVTDGLNRLVDSLERTGSDLAVGFLAGPDDPKLGGHPPAPPRMTAQAVTLAERPELVCDASPLGKVFRRSFLTDHEVWWADRPGEELVGTIRAYAAARAIDIVDATVCLCRATSVPCWSIGPADWATDAAAVAELLAGHPAAVVFADDAVRRVFPTQAAALAAAAPASRASVGRTFRRLIELGSPGTPAALRLSSRWELARCVLADDSSAGLPEALAASLGLGDLSVGEAERTRFAARAPRPWPAPAGTVPRPAEPEVSVVIPTHNVAGYVDELLHSVRAATGVALEIVVIDDHSTDGTWEKLQAHAAADARVQVHRATGKGGGPARNQGVELASGEYLAFADGDDLVPPHAYETLLSAARRTRAEVAVGSYLRFGATWVWDASRSYDYRVGIDAATLAQHPWLIRHRACWNRLYRRDFWIDRQVTFPAAVRSNDIVPMTRVLTAADRITLVPVIAYLYRDRPGAGSMTAKLVSADSTASYLTQELACSLLVEQYGAPEVTTKYWEMVVAEDGWRGLKRFLRANADVAGASHDELCSLVGALIGAAPAAAIARLTPGQRGVYGLVQLGRIDLAASLERPDSMDLRRAAEVLRVAGGSPLVTRDDLSRLIVRHLLQRMIQDPPDLALAEELVALVRELATTHEIELAVVPTELEGQLAHALLHGDGRDVLGVLAPEPVTATARPTSQGPAVEGTTDVGRARRLVATRTIGRRMEQRGVGDVVAAPGGWRATLAGASLAPGTWQLSLEYDGDQGLRRRPLRIKAKRGSMDQLARLVVTRSGIEIRRPLATRARQLVARRLGLR